MAKAMLLSILGTDSDIADKYYTHIGDEAQLKAIAAISGNDNAATPQQRIAKALEYIESQPSSELTNKIIYILTKQR